eukprot:355760-Chlamydomonas_euryale.AAC.1
MARCSHTFPHPYTSPPPTHTSSPTHFTPTHSSTQKPPLQHIPTRTFYPPHIHPRRQPPLPHTHPHPHILPPHIPPFARPPCSQPQRHARPDGGAVQPLLLAAAAALHARHREPLLLHVWLVVRRGRGPPAAGAGRVGAVDPLVWRLCHRRRKDAQHV